MNQLGAFRGIAHDALDRPDCGSNGLSGQTGGVAGSASASAGPECRVPNRLLVVDDEPDSARVIAQFLSLVGFDVRTAGGVAEALTEFTEWEPDLVVSDFRLSNSNGETLIQTMREKSPTLPAVIVTGDPSVVDRFHEQICGGRTVALQKPIELAALTTLVGEMLGRKNTG